MNILNSDTDTDWPDNERFPYNYVNSRVEAVIQKDLDESKHPLIITGYASLDRILDFLAYAYHKLKWHPDAFETIRILLGNEPYPSKALEFRHSNKFSQEIVDYWLERRISILKCAKVIAAIELLKSGKVQARIGRDAPRTHAKIYKGDNAITLGSSNYSTSGLIHQIEGNVRFKQKKETKRFDEACLLAENIWEQGINYNEQLSQLLEQLLSKVSWQESLARACVELLEGEWAKRYQTTSYLDDRVPLWPSQEKGIAQAIWVMENVGSVLIADATGSGKTRMGSHLVKGVMNWILGTGRQQQDMKVMICPPAVKEPWKTEFLQCGQNVEIVSHGLLSNPDASIEDHTTIAIRRAQILAVDEAHNFLNRRSLRTRTLLANMADYILLFTATPINRGPQDLLSIIELLGADNFDDEVLKVLESVWKRRGNLNKRMSLEERDKVRTAIQQFTVRRTKIMLNSIIAREPERYRNRLGKLCRYPQHQPETYFCGETVSDRALAAEIRAATEEFRGLVNLKETLKLPESLRKEGWTDEQYLRWRLKSAKILAAYQVMACLRSSRAALLEHAYGTDYVQKHLGFLKKVKAKETGNLIKTLQDIADKPPKNKLQIPLPDWLSNPAKHKQACEEEREIYQEIANLTERISESRENTKAKLLIELLKRHKLLIAFDSRPITLNDIKRRLERLGNFQEVIIATGTDAKERKRINQMFNPESEASGIIGLCSDAMSEGVNLQGASAVVQLTMPSVIRLAEQRIGRVDRMDSPHPQIEAWWPKDSDEFALLSSERKFLDRHGLVSDLLGSNLPLPENLSPEIDKDASDRPVELQEFIAELNKDRYELGDVFDPVRSLVEGDHPLLTPQVYNQLRASKARAVSLVSVVEAKHPWAFFAIAGTESGAPRWVYLDNSQPKPITNLEQISQKLRENLVLPVTDLPIEKATPVLEKFCKRLSQTESVLLPKKKQRALEEMKLVLKKYEEEATKSGESERKLVVNYLLSRLEVDSQESRLDLSILADWWLDLIRPWWFERLKERRSTPLRLKHIRKDIIQQPIPTEKLREALNVPQVKPLDERIVATIIGVP